LIKESRTEVSEVRTVGAAQTRETASDRAYEKETESAYSTIKNSEGDPETQALTSTTTANDEASTTPTIAITADSETTSMAAVAGNIINMHVFVKTGPSTFLVISNCLEIYTLLIYSTAKYFSTGTETAISSATLASQISQSASSLSTALNSAVVSSSVALANTATTSTVVTRVLSASTSTATTVNYNF
jgi:hypothetical protein